MVVLSHLHTFLRLRLGTRRNSTPGGFPRHKATRPYDHVKCDVPPVVLFGTKAGSIEGIGHSRQDEQYREAMKFLGFGCSDLHRFEQLHRGERACLDPDEPVVLELELPKSGHVAKVGTGDHGDEVAFEFERGEPRE